MEWKKAISVGGKSFDPPQRSQSKRARVHRSEWESPCAEARIPVVVLRKAAAARMSFGWEEKWPERLAKAVMMGGESAGADIDADAVVLGLGIALRRRSA